MLSLYGVLIELGEAVEEWAERITPEIEVGEQPNYAGSELHMAIDTDVRKAVAQLAFLKNTDYANDFRRRFDDLFESADGYFDRLLMFIEKHHQRCSDIRQRSKVLVAEDTKLLETASHDDGGSRTICTPGHQATPEEDCAAKTYESWRECEYDSRHAAAHLKTAGEHLAEHVYTTAILVAESTGQDVVIPDTRRSVREGVRKVHEWFECHDLQLDETGNFAPASALFDLIEQYNLDYTSTWLERGTVASSAMFDARYFRHAKLASHRLSSQTETSPRSKDWLWEIAWLGPVVNGLAFGCSTHEEDAEVEPAENNHPSEKRSGEWSLPMSKTEMMTRLHLNPRAFDTFARTHGLEKISRQQWQIRVDTMDQRTRKRIETGR